MELGALDLQIFASLVVVLFTALVAFVTDYLKGSNEQLREKNVELRVRSEERERRGVLDPGSFVPQAWFEQFFAAARKAGWAPAYAPATAEAYESGDIAAAQRPARYERKNEVARTVAPEVRPADEEALAARAEAMSLRVERDRRAPVVEAEPIVSPKVRKSAEDFVNPAMLAKVALKADLQAAPVAIVAPVKTEEPLAPVAMEPSVIEDAIEQVVPTQIVPTAAIELASATPVFVPVASDSVRQEIHRLKEQAKIKFAAQYAKVEEPVVTLSSGQGTPAAKIVRPTYESFVAEYEEEDDVREFVAPQPDTEFGEDEQIPDISAMDTPDNPAEKPTLLVMPMAESIVDLNLQQELNRVVEPDTSASGLLDQIIHDSGEQEFEQLQKFVAEPLEPISQKLSFTPKGSTFVSQSAEDHDAILRELLGRNNEELLLEDDTVDGSEDGDQQNSIIDDLLNDAEPPASFFTEVIPVVAVLESTTFPIGMHDNKTLNELIAAKQLVTGVVILAGINDYSKLVADKSPAQIEEMTQPAVKLISGIIREKDFAARIDDDKWVMIFSGELGNAAQRRIDSVAEKFWDYQLRNLGHAQLRFSTGAVQVERESLSEAVDAAQERMEQLRNKGKRNDGGVQRKLVNS